MFSRQPMTYNGMRTALSLPNIVYTKITKKEKKKRRAHLLAMRAGFLDSLDRSEFLLFCSIPFCSVLYRICNSRNISTKCRQKRDVIPFPLRFFSPLKAKQTRSLHAISHMIFKKEKKKRKEKKEQQHILSKHTNC